MFEFQENSTLSYQLGYVTGTSIAVSGISWITGKILFIVGGALENTCSGSFRETGFKYYGKKWANGIKMMGNVLTFPVDAVLVGSCIWVQMTINSLVKKNMEQPDSEGMEEIRLPDTPFPPVSDMRILFNGFVREMPKNLRSLFLGSWSQAYDDLYQKYLSLDFDGRCDMRDYLRENAQEIRSADMILQLFDGYKAWFKNPILEWWAIVGEENTTNSDDELGNPNFLSPENIKKALEEWMMNPSQAEFLSFAQKKPGN